MQCSRENISVVIIPQLLLIQPMINFTGQSKKRVVNLGSRNSRLTSGGYLEQSKQQRLQRELQRQRERAALVLQSYIRKHLDLRRQAEQIKQDWINGTDINETWFVQFAFICRWLLPYQTLMETCSDLEVLKRQLNGNTGEGTIQLLVDLYGLLSSKRTDPDYSKVLELLSSIFQPLVDSGEVGPTQREKLLTILISALKGESFTDNISNSIHLAFSVSLPGSGDLVKLLSFPNAFSPSRHHLEILRQNLAIGSFPELDDDSIVNVLVNFLVILGDEPFLNEDMAIIASILGKILFSLTYDDDTDEMDSKLDRVLTKDSLKYIEKLYSPQFINQVLDSLKGPYSSSGLQILSTLFYLYPPLKSKLCVLFTITAGSFRWLFNQLQNDQIYTAIFRCAKDYLNKEELDQLYLNTDDSEVTLFWKNLYTFEELYSYWLIVSNDLESFQEEKLTLAEVSEFLVFLRTLCLTLVLQPDPDRINHFENLKSISLSLLNQLYLKNVRLNFLPDKFWILKDLQFNIDTLLQYIAEDEERRIEDDDRDDEIDEVKPLRVKRSGATLEVTSKLEVLKKLPFFIAFKDRVKIFQSLIELDRQRLSSAHWNPFTEFSSKLEADIRREHVLEDAFNLFNKCGTTLKNQLQVNFFNQYGGQEAGIDGGGITKEFLTSVVAEGFNPETGLFSETGDNQIYPNDEISKKLNKDINVAGQQEKLLYIKFLGNIVGKCFYENVLIDVSFAPFFLNKWCNDNLKNSINDLNYLDHELFANLMKLSKMTKEELDLLDLSFSVDEVLDGKSYVFDLLGGEGFRSKVDESNRLNYIHAISNFKLNQSLYIQTKYFLEGLYEMISSSWLNMFDSSELQMLISGGENDVNIQDWKENVEYGGFFDDDLTVRYFWEVVEEMAPLERFKLIKFVTSVSRAPLLGFGSLWPKFGIRNSGRDADRLPTASTCVNLLKLPDYRDKEIVRNKLLYAINMDAGFDLS